MKEFRKIVKEFIKGMMFYIILFIIMIIMWKIAEFIISIINIKIIFTLVWGTLLLGVMYIFRKGGM